MRRRRGGRRAGMPARAGKFLPRCGSAADLSPVFFGKWARSLRRRRCHFARCSGDPGPCRREQRPAAWPPGSRKPLIPSASGTRGAGTKPGFSPLRFPVRPSERCENCASGRPAALGEGRQLCAHRHRLVDSLRSLQKCPRASALFCSVAVAGALVAVLSFTCSALLSKREKLSAVRYCLRKAGPK